MLASHSSVTSRRSTTRCLSKQYVAHRVSVVTASLRHGKTLQTQGASAIRP